MKIQDYISKLFIYGFLKFLRHAFYTLVFYRLYRQKILGSYSQNEEDRVIDKLLNYKKRGFYIDVGAYDPTQFSNTKRFYIKGWRGINIEPDPDNFKKFLKVRKRDINLNIGIGNKSDKLIYYKFFPNTVSTFSVNEMKRNLRKKYKLIKKIKVPVKKLSSILEKYCQQKIDFMSIDTEGFDLIVLKSNNWKKFKPKVICIESQKANKFLSKIRYRKIYDNGINSLYMILS